MSDNIFDGGIQKARLLLRKMKSLICDVISDYHLIGERRNRTISPQERIFPSKSIEFSVMWYVYNADEKGERFNPVAGTIPYLTDVSERNCC